MNIFVLHTDPKIAALYHCDQHMNKMIVESAQMLSTAARRYERFKKLERFLMKPAYENHPCTRWAGESLANMAWLADMAIELEEQRASSRENAASPVIRVIAEELADTLEAPKEFIFCGPEDLRAIPAEDASVVTRYRSLYRRKQDAWKSTAHAMSYDGRVLPEFLEGLGIKHEWKASSFKDDRELSELFCRTAY